MSCRVRQIDHVTLVVAHLERSQYFYEHVLGMQVVPRPNFSFAGQWLQAGSTLIHLILEHSASGPAGNTIPAGTNIGRTPHIAFEVESVAGAKIELERLGIEIVSGPKTRPDGAVQICILDPDKHVIELFNS